MIARAFRDIWARVMFFKFSKLHEPHDHISRNARAIIRFFIYNILNKLRRKTFVTSYRDLRAPTRPFYG